MGEMKEELNDNTWCNWKVADYGSMGCSSYEFKIDCRSNIDVDDVSKRVASKFNYCPFCGKQINVK